MAELTVVFKSKDGDFAIIKSPVDLNSYKIKRKKMKNKEI